MLTITTTFYGPTNTRGARIKVTDGQGRTLWVNYDYGDAAHDAAFRTFVATHLTTAYCPATWHRGSVARGYVYVANGHTVMV